MAPMRGAGRGVKPLPQERAEARPTLRVDFGDAGGVAAAFEGGGEPGAHDLQRLGFGHGPLADGETIAVVVRTVPDRELFVPAEAAADAAHAVGDDRFAVAGAAEDDA